MIADTTFVAVLTISTQTQNATEVPMLEDFTMTWVCSRTGKHRTTVARWHGRRAYPPEVIRLARIELDGELGLIDPRWEGWRLCWRHGVLIPPPVNPLAPFTPGEILAFGYKVERMHALERELMKLRASPRAEAIAIAGRDARKRLVGE